MPFIYSDIQQTSFSLVLKITFSSFISCVMPRQHVSSASNRQYVLHKQIETIVVTLPPLFTFLFLFFVLSIFFLLTFVHDKIVVGDGWGRGVSRFGGLSPTGLSLLPLALPLQMLYLSDQRHVLQFFFGSPILHHHEGY